ncbi:DUF1707 SHOCT-like domain-containing protein [Pseudonocardia sp. GCM10023141]|uniref:DUF1707 SHOCT-like domain-containing protein n=1 Tax=Pseudonocardia sp. GCM10023141 TaxID=3252653 RepID=UPI003611D4A3
MTDKEVAVMDPTMRASDADREQMVRRLQRHVAAGRLSLTEFSERAAAAYRAPTIGELAALHRDLPDLPDLDDLPVQPATSAPAGGLALLGSALPATVLVGIVLLALALTALSSVLPGAAGFCH